MPPITPAEQLDEIATAIRLLGGHRAAARVLGISERNLLRIAKGQSPAHEGLMRRISEALLAHIEACKICERRITPAFAANRTAAQAALGPADKRRFDLKGEG